VNYQGESYPGSQTYIDRTLDISNVSLITEKNEISKSKIDIIEGKKVRILKKDSTPVIREKIVKKTEKTKELK
jgi:hypothetical protein